MQTLVGGLTYLPNYLAEKECNGLVSAVDGMPWLKRRVQHYGYRYDYKARRVVPEMYLGPITSLGRVACRALRW